jgi:large conductance mechanosensitive channel
MLKEFRAFAMRGNVLDMAVGIIIGGAFGKIISSLVSDVLMPPIGAVVGNVDFSKLALTLRTPVGDAAPVTIRYGLFMNTIVDFLIVAFAIFLLIRQLNKFTAKPAPAAAPTTRDCPECLSPIPIKARKCAHCTSPMPALPAA